MYSQAVINYNIFMHILCIYRRIGPMEVDPSVIAQLHSQLVPDLENSDDSASDEEDACWGWESVSHNSVSYITSTVNQAGYDRICKYYKYYNIINTNRIIFMYMVLHIYRYQVWFVPKCCYLVPVRQLVSNLLICKCIKASLVVW